MKPFFYRPNLWWVCYQQHWRYINRAVWLNVFYIECVQSCSIQPNCSIQQVRCFPPKYWLWIAFIQWKCKCSCFLDFTFSLRIINMCKFVHTKIFTPIHINIAWRAECRAWLAIYVLKTLLHCVLMQEHTHDVKVLTVLLVYFKTSYHDKRRITLKKFVLIFFTLFPFNCNRRLGTTCIYRFF